MVDAISIKLSIAMVGAISALNIRKPLMEIQDVQHLNAQRDKKY
jgi:hypothetical protein